MTKLTKFEQMMLAPEDPAWDERVRDEFYRGCAIAYTASLYGCWAVAVIAVAIDEVVSGVLIFLVPTGASLLLYRYCGRRGIDVQKLAEQFSANRRFWTYATTYPLIIAFALLVFWRIGEGRFDFDAATLAGMAVGGAVGGVIGWFALRLLRRRTSVAEPDDTFD